MSSDLRQYFTDTILPLHGRMYIAAFAITGSVDDASDAVQTAMLRIWETLNDGSKIDRPLAYCLSTVRNICLKEINRNKNRVSIEAFSIEDSVNPAESIMELNEVSDALSLLSESERRAVELRAYAGCSSKDIAEELGTNSINARKILSRGRKKLKSFFTK